MCTDTLAKLECDKEAKEGGEDNCQPVDVAGMHCEHDVLLPGHVSAVPLVQRFGFGSILLSSHCPHIRFCGLQPVGASSNCCF